MQISTEDIIKELSVQDIPEGYTKEAITIVQEYIDIKGCTLQEAVNFVARWVKFAEM